MVMGCAGPASAVPSVGASTRCQPLPKWLRPPHHTQSLLQKLLLRSHLGSPSLRSSRRIMPPADFGRHVRHQQSMRGHQYAVYCVTYDTTGRIIITGSDDHNVKVQLSMRFVVVVFAMLDH